MSNRSKIGSGNSVWAVFRISVSKLKREQTSLNPIVLKIKYLEERFTSKREGAGRDSGVIRAAKKLNCALGETTEEA